MKQRDTQTQAARRPSSTRARTGRLRLKLGQPQIDIGVVAEHLAAAALSALGHEVTYPAPSRATYDMTMCRFTNGVRGRSETVQVKWVGETRNGLRLQRGRRKYPDNKPYMPGDFDFLAVVRSDALYLIPFRALKKRVTITVTSSEWAQYRLPIAAESIESLAALRRALKESERRTDRQQDSSTDGNQPEHGNTVDSAA